MNMFSLVGGFLSHTLNGVFNKRKFLVLIFNL